MKHMKEVEYCQFQLTIQKRQAFDTIYSVVGNQYSSVENEGYMIIYIYIKRKTVKLYFKKIGSYIRLMGKNYTFEEECMVEIMEQMISEGKGHVIIKRTSKNYTLYIENMIYGEVSMITEIKGECRKVLYQRKNVVSIENLEQTWASQDAEQRIAVCKLEIDYALSWLHESLENNNKTMIDLYTQKLKSLHIQRISLEM